MHRTHAAFCIALSLPTLVFGMAPAFVFPNDLITYKNPLHNLTVYETKSLATLKSLLGEKKYDVNEEYYAKGDGPVTYTPIHCAIVMGNIGAVELLLTYGADPNQMTTIAPITPLSLCISCGSPEITSLLIHRGANALDAAALLEALNRIHFSDQPQNIALLLRAGLNPVAIQCDGKTAFEYMAEKFASMRTLIDSSKYLKHKEKELALYQKVGRALARYKMAWQRLNGSVGLPEEITLHILRFVDFGLDDYHAPIVKCAICYDEKKFRAIPCSKNSHPDSICSDCIGKLTDCPLCREPLTK